MLSNDAPVGGGGFDHLASLQHCSWGKGGVWVGQAALLNLSLLPGSASGTGGLAGGTGRASGPCGRRMGRPASPAGQTGRVGRAVERAGWAAHPGRVAERPGRGAGASGLRIAISQRIAGLLL